MKKKLNDCKLGTCVEIEWVDSGFAAGWQYNGEMQPIPIITTIGYVSHIDKMMIEISSTITPNGSLNPLAIPHGCITSIRKVKVGN